MKVPQFLLELDEEKFDALVQWLKSKDGNQWALVDAKLRFDDPDYDKKTPLFYRDCPDCVFLGNFKDKSLYYCTNPKYAKTIVHETHDLVFGVRTFAEDDEWYIEAENRAMLRGLISGLEEKK